MKNRTTIPTLRTIIYILSACVFLPGTITGINLLAGSGSVQNVLMPFQGLGGGTIVNLVTPYLTSFLSGLGIVTLVISLVISLVLLALGSLLGANANLEARVTRLEAASSPTN